MSQKDDKQRDEFLARMAMLRLQERQESREEIAARIYQYRGNAMSTGTALLCPGDYMLLSSDDHYLVSGRGAQIDNIDIDSLLKMVDSGVLDHVFDAADINSPAFQGKLDKILDNMIDQADYSDGYAYCKIHKRDVGVDYADHNQNKSDFADMRNQQNSQDNITCALFAPDKFSTPTALVLRSGTEFFAEAGNSITDSFKDMFKSVTTPDKKIDNENIKQCSYQEFNPGMKNISQELKMTVNNDRENSEMKFQEIRDEIVKSNMSKKETDKNIEDTDEEETVYKDSIRERLRAENEKINKMQLESENDSEDDSEDFSALEKSSAMRWFM